MNIINQLASGGVEGVFKGVGSFARDMRAAITGKEALTAEQLAELERASFMLENKALELEIQAGSGQIQLNALDAKSGSFFKGGWRPALGWVGVCQDCATRFCCAHYCPGASTRTVGCLVCRR